MAQPARMISHHDAPAPDPQRSRDPGLARTREILGLVFGPSDERTFDIHLWDGSVDRSTSQTRADFALHVCRRGALRRMLIRPSELSIVEAFISRDLDVSGNLESAMSLGDAVGSRIQSVSGAVKLLPKILALPADDVDPALDAHRFQRPRLARASGRRATADEIEFHYGVGNDFYALWLDERMIYSCAYYKSETDDLASAQTAKLDHICRKLRLMPGERLLDIGCGWGGLIQHAAEHYGVQALGITLSESQAAGARKSIEARGLTDRCRVEIVDFRDLPTSQKFDKMSSVGVMEHVPEAEQPAYFARAHALLEPGGLFMNHCIVSLSVARSRNTLAERFNRWLWKRDQFIDKYVFPDGRIVSFGSLIKSAELAGFETRDVESLREHYTRTLRAWVATLQRRKEEAVAIVGERTYRVWHLYMSASAHGFDSGSLGLVQTLLSKPSASGRSNLPLTREDLYRS
ncbi:MAG: cyclopropane-fatty-acyl-phospholipid synthase family protein [Gemmatimonadota bacterium]